jgi:hypothetical protein
VKVTADTITDEQIRELEHDASGLGRNPDANMLAICAAALAGDVYARFHCAAVWNARHGGAK